MNEYVICEKENLTAIANAVRTSTGSTQTFNVSELSAITVNTLAAGGAMPDVSGQIAEHNSSPDAHSDIRAAIPTATSQLTNDSGYLTQETDPTVPAWAKEANPPTYTASQVGADPAGTAASAVSTHNTNTSAHNDIRLLVTELTNRLNALADSDDTTLDQMSEIVAYIKSNKSLIDSVTTSKVNTADIIDNLTTNVATKPLSAAQGVALKSMVDAKAAKSDLTGLATESYVQAQIQAAIANLMTREQMEAYVNEAILGGEW